MLDKKDLEVKNYMEEAVLHIIDSILDNVKACTCNNCVSDVMAITLNNLPPKYVVTKKGELYTKINNLQQQYDVDIVSAITRAHVMVSRNPRHDV